MEKIEEGIKALVKVQNIDSEIYKLRQKKVAKPAEKAVLQEAFSQKSSTLKEGEGNLKSKQLKRKEFEIELETKEKNIEKCKAQLFQLKTNKEYMSMQKEIEGLKADKSVLEDDILELMEKIDKAKASLAEEREKLAAEEKKLNEETQRVDQEVRTIEEQLSSLEKERNQLSAAVEKGLFARYERILKGKGELSLVPVIGESCGGCHRVLPPQVINEARKKDKIITCEFCARLLYWPE